MNKCIFCEKAHGEIYQRFSTYMLPEFINEKECKEFPRYIEFEIQQGNWAEIYCLVKRISSKGYIKSKKNEFFQIVWRGCIQLEKMMRRGNYEDMNKFFKKYDIMYNQVISKNRENMKKEINIVNLNEEKNKILDLVNFIAENKEFEFEEQMRNYIVSRLVSLYENTIKKMLLDNFGNVSKEKLDIFFESKEESKRFFQRHTENPVMELISDNKQFNNNPNSLNKFLKNFTEIELSVMNNKISNNYDFFIFVESVFEFNKEIDEDGVEAKLIEYGGWKKFLEKVNKERNRMTHDLNPTKFPIEELLYISELYIDFLKIFTPVIDFIVNYIHASTIESKENYFEQLKNNTKFDSNLINIKNYTDVDSSIRKYIIKA